MDLPTRELPGGPLPDGTAAAQSGGTNGSLNVVSVCNDEPDYNGPFAEPAEDARPLGHDFDVHDVKATPDVLKAGFAKLETEREGLYDVNNTGEEPVGDPSKYGGFLGRQRGDAR